MKVQLANRMNSIQASEIRELLKLTEKPEIISFAGGLPDPNVFPIEELKKIACSVLDETGKEALQYAPTEGYTRLRNQISQRMNKRFGTQLTGSNILITSGSQQGLDLSGKIFLNEGDTILCESPTYLGAINAFNAYKPRYIEIPTDESGMDIQALEKTLLNEKKIKLIYAIPDFQNPTGRTWSEKRRRQFMQVMRQYDIPVIEDNPYGELRYEGTPIPSLNALDHRGQVIFLGTFSKTFCPGLRLGWVAADEATLKHYILSKQGLDLHTSSLSQRELSRFLEIYDMDTHIDKIRNVYKRRRDLMINTMKSTFPQEIHYTEPNGGLFCWVTVPEYIDTKEVLIKSIKNNVAFVPGESFYPNSKKKNTLRLNYSNASDENIVIGITRLAKMLNEFIKH
ncbi:MAG: PLP-dependent aminotransferase family protein [Clostridia bacterium]|nr:PLP-dependent aminotransferase family protein [Clostridia bacterium]